VTAQWKRVLSPQFGSDVVLDMLNAGGDEQERKKGKQNMKMNNEKIMDHEYA
jgi:hypothetical protein